MISAGGKKGGLLPIHRGELKAQQIAIKAQCPLKVRHLEVDMPDHRLIWYFVIAGARFNTGFILSFHKHFFSPGFAA